MEFEATDSKVEHLRSAMESLKALGGQESESHYNVNKERAELEAEITEVGSILAAGDISSSRCLSRDLSESLEKLDFAKGELAARLKAILSLKRKLGDVPAHSELIQYERRFSELYAHIQEKHRQTQKYYSTYNALLEIKELMLKEFSLLNSISSQFQDAITSTAGRSKLINSMEKIAKGSQQKLEKVQVGLREEQKICDAVKGRYAAAVVGQRRCSYLLKALQEECRKNERLQGQISK